MKIENFYHGIAEDLVQHEVSVRNRQLVLRACGKKYITQNVLRSMATNLERISGKEVKILTNAGNNQGEIVFLAKSYWPLWPPQEETDTAAAPPELLHLLDGVRAPAYLTDGKVRSILAFNEPCENIVANVGFIPGVSMEDAVEQHFAPLVTAQMRPTFIREQMEGIQYARESPETHVHTFEAPLVLRDREAWKGGVFQNSVTALRVGTDPSYFLVIWNMRRLESLPAPQILWFQDFANRIAASIEGKGFPSASTTAGILIKWILRWALILRLAGDTE